MVSRAVRPRLQVSGHIDTRRLDTRHRELLLSETTSASTPSAWMPLPQLFQVSVSFHVCAIRCNTAPSLQFVTLTSRIADWIDRTRRHLTGAVAEDVIEAHQDVILRTEVNDQRHRRRVVVVSVIVSSIQVRVDRPGVAVGTLLRTRQSQEPDPSHTRRRAAEPPRSHRRTTRRRARPSPSMMNAIALPRHPTTAIDDLLDNRARYHSTDASHPTVSHASGAHTTSAAVCVRDEMSPVSHW